MEVVRCDKSSGAMLPSKTDIERCENEAVARWCHQAGKGAKRNGMGGEGRGQGRS